MRIMNSWPVSLTETGPQTGNIIWSKMTGLPVDWRDRPLQLKASKIGKSSEISDIMIAEFGCGRTLVNIFYITFAEVSLILVGLVIKGRNDSVLIISKKLWIAPLEWILSRLMLKSPIKKQCLLFSTGFANISWI